MFGFVQIGHLFLFFRKGYSSSKSLLRKELITMHVGSDGCGLVLVA